MLGRKNSTGQFGLEQCQKDKCTNGYVGEREREKEGPMGGTARLSVTFETVIPAQAGMTVLSVAVYGNCGGF
jgi:hypothetical protein